MLTLHPCAIPYIRIMTQGDAHRYLEILDITNYILLVRSVRSVWAYYIHRKP